MANIIINFEDFSMNEKKKTAKKKSSDSNKSDEDLYLTAGQKKLPDAFKKSIIAKKKKSGNKPTEEKEVDGKEGKEDVKPKKTDASKSDEENYLSAKQRKLPEGLKKGIIARAKKAKKD